jgi:dTDP-4-dehydrorhamnose reductase
MRILLFGKNGQLGREFQRSLPPLGEVQAFDIADLDLSDRKALVERIGDIHPHVIVNAAAYTAVDRAESEPDLAARVNAQAPQAMAEMAARLSAVFIHFSTDYVFDGEKGSAYIESDAPAPINVYGRTKWEGEQAVLRAGGAGLVFRTSWVYSLQGEGFLAKALAWSRSREVLRVVDDQIGSPTWARALAAAVTRLLADWGPEPYPAALPLRGLYHLAGKGAVSRYAWARAILDGDPQRGEQRCRSLEPARSDEFPTPARRPAYSALDCSRFERTFGFGLPDWRESLGEALAGP